MQRLETMRHHPRDLQPAGVGANIDSGKGSGKGWHREFSQAAGPWQAHNLWQQYNSRLRSWDLNPAVTLALHRNENRRLNLTQSSLRLRRLRVPRGWVAGKTVP
jgi:hypothetical protein